MAMIKKRAMTDRLGLNAVDKTTAFNQRLADTYFQNHPDRIYTPSIYKYVVVKTTEGDRVEEVRELIVHQFTMGDVEDPDLYAAEPLMSWEQSEVGQWCMKNACDTPTWHRMPDIISYGYSYQIRAKFMGPALTEWLLRYGDT
jgi:hypothetical protein